MSVAHSRAWHNGPHERVLVVTDATPKPLRLPPMPKLANKPAPRGKVFVCIACDEMYPCYEAKTRVYVGDRATLVSRKSLARWQAIWAAFTAMQSELANLQKATGEPTPGAP